MITSKELQYVESWANKTPMPGIEYSLKVLNEIKECYESYLEKYKDKEYNIIFSNGEEIEFEILPKNLCHMMGIDYNNIKGEYFDKYRNDVFGISTSDFNSFNLLEMILENIDKVAEYDNDPANSAKALNYYKSAIKCAIYKKISDFEKFNFAAINYIGTKEGISYENSKNLFVSSNETLTPYFIMGIVKQEIDTNRYAVSTLKALKEPKPYFENQEVIIPTQILVSDNNILRKLLATPEEKIKLLTMYENIINKYNIPNRLNIYGDYQNILNDLTNNKTKKLTL